MSKHLIYREWHLCLLFFCLFRVPKAVAFHTRLGGGLLYKLVANVLWTWWKLKTRNARSLRCFVCLATYEFVSASWSCDLPQTTKLREQEKDLQQRDVSESAQEFTVCLARAMWPSWLADRLRYPSRSVIPIKEYMMIVDHFASALS